MFLYTIKLITSGVGKIFPHNNKRIGLADVSRWLRSRKHRKIFQKTWASWWKLDMYLRTNILHWRRQKGASIQVNLCSNGEAASWFSESFSYPINVNVRIIRFSSETLTKKCTLKRKKCFIFRKWTVKRISKQVFYAFFPSLFLWSMSTSTRRSSSGSHRFPEFGVTDFVRAWKELKRSETIINVFWLLPL